MARPPATPSSTPSSLTPPISGTQTFHTDSVCSLTQTCASRWRRAWRVNRWVVYCTASWAYEMLRVVWFKTLLFLCCGSFCATCDRLMTPTRGRDVRRRSEVWSAGAAISEWGFRANGCTWEKCDGIRKRKLESSNSIFKRIGWRQRWLPRLFLFWFITFLETQ